MEEKPYYAGLGLKPLGPGTHATPAIHGRDLTEGYLTQPNLRVCRRTHSCSSRRHLEGQTLQRGELNAGTWGEGYVDRRHPHTYLHEAIATVGRPALGGFWSLTAGKGFAPFGTDDPMVRPLLKFPANHHLSQILERLIVVGAVQKGPLIVEAGVFNGDEPIDPSSLGRLSRFGDSWSARVTGLVGPDIELQASHAYLTSPEPVSGGVDQSKWSVSDGTSECEPLPIHCTHSPSGRAPATCMVVLK